MSAYSLVEDFHLVHSPHMTYQHRMMRMEMKISKLMFQQNRLHVDWIPGK